MPPARGRLANNELRFPISDTRQLEVKVGGLNDVCDLSEQITEFRQIYKVRKSRSHTKTSSGGLNLHSLCDIAENTRPVIEIFDAELLESAVLQKVLPDEHFRYSVAYRSTCHKADTAAVVYFLHISYFQLKVECPLRIGVRVYAYNIRHLGKQGKIFVVVSLIYDEIVAA